MYVVHVVMGEEHAAFDGLCANVVHQGERWNAEHFIIQLLSAQTENILP